MSNFKRFTIRTLIVVVTLICIALALDAAISYRLAKLQSEIEESPTASILSQGSLEHEHTVNCLRWQLVGSVDDLSTIYDRISLRRRLKVSHRRQSLLGDRTFQSLWMESDINLGLTAVTIKQRALNDQSAQIDPDTFPIPEDAISIAAQPPPKQDLHKKFELLSEIPENARLTQSEVLELADQYVLQKLNESEFEKYPNRKLTCSTFPIGEWWVYYHTNPISDATFFIKIADETGEAKFGGATPPIQELLNLFY